MKESRLKVIITDVESRKSFDVVNVMQRLYGFDCLLCSGKDENFQLPLIYGQRVYRLRSTTYDDFLEDFDKLLARNADFSLVYLTVSEKPTRWLYRYLKDHTCPQLHLLLPTETNFNMTSNKALFQDFCEAHSFPVPRSFDQQDLPALKESFRPLILKPRSGQGSVGIKYFNEPEELAGLDQIKWDDYILQEKIESKSQVAGAFFLCKDGKVVNAYSHQRLRTFPIEGGVTVFSQSTNTSEIIEIGGKLLEALQWNGFAMIEFMYDEFDGSWKIIELNPRLWGSVLLAGFNNSGMLKQFVEIAGKSELSSGYELKSVYIRWLFPFDFFNWVKGRISWEQLFAINRKETCYVNFTYSPWSRSLLYLIYFTFNFSSILRFIKKLK
jgi:predicted ATP-grasp superfamily ATP-dependent carboligase